MSEPAGQDRVVSTGIPATARLAAFLVTALVGGSFFMTGLFFAHVMGIRLLLAGGVWMGLIPGLVTSGLHAGMLFALSGRRAKIWVPLLTLTLPIPGVLWLVGVGSPWATGLSLVGSLIGVWVGPALVAWYRRKGFGKVKGPKGSYEELF